MTAGWIHTLIPMGTKSQIRYKCHSSLFACFPLLLGCWFCSYCCHVGVVAVVVVYVYVVDVLFIMPLCKEGVKHV